MILASFWQNPGVIGIIVAIPSATLGYLGYRRSMKVDKVAEQAGIATSQTTSIGQVVDGLNNLIAHLQKDNENLREDVEAIRTRLDNIESGNLALQAKNLELEREIKVIHAENAELKIENQKLKVRIVELEKVNHA